MTMYEKTVMEFFAGNLRKRFVGMIVRNEIGNNAWAREIAESYNDGWTAEGWADAIQNAKPEAEKLTPEQLEMLTMILKIILAILAAL